jgi:hypothetical protein
MTITLANLNPATTTEAIKLGSGVFKVLYDGTLTATSATIDGTIYAQEGRIGCTKSGSTRSGGWIITAGKLYSGSGTSYVELNSDSSNNYAMLVGNSVATSAKFIVTKAGIITAKEGAIGGWSLINNRLTANSGKIGLASSGAGNYRIWINSDNDASSSTSTPTFTNSSTYFWVNSSGKLSCKNAEVRGDIYASGGTIGNWQIKNNRL